MTALKTNELIILPTYLGRQRERLCFRGGERDRDASVIERDAWGGQSIVF